MTIPSTLPEQIGDIYRRMSEIERRARNRRRTGKIAEVDTATGKYRVKLSEQGGQPFLTDWIRPRQLGAAGVKIDVLLSEGEQVDVVSESGDGTDAMIEMSAYSDANPRENSDTPLHIKIGNSVFAVTGDEVTLKTGEFRIEGKVTIVGDVLTHNGKDVGDTHRHRDTMPGGGLSGVPA